MAYRGYPYEVMMWPNSVTDNVPVTATVQKRGHYNVFSFNVTTNPSGNGFAAWGPGIYPHMVQAIGFETLSNQANPFNVYFHLRPQVTTGTLVMTFPIPTTAATGKVALRYATALIEVEPGMKLVASVSDPIDGAQGIAYLLVEPRFVHPATMANVTTATG